MTNAKKEFLHIIEGKTVLCADIHLDQDWDKDLERITLKRGYTQAELDSFLEKLDFEYDSGYGSQNLFGNIWFTDNTWAERGEYDGSEWWQIPNRPKICDDL